METNEEKAKILERIVELRKAKGFDSLSKFSVEIGMLPRTVQNQIDSRRLSIDLIISICNKYPEVNMNWLLKGEGDILGDTSKQNGYINSEFVDTLMETLRIYNSMLGGNGQANIQENQISKG